MLDDIEEDLRYQGLPYTVYGKSPIKQDLIKAVDAWKRLNEFEKAIEAHKNATDIEPENLYHYFYLSELKKDFLNELSKNECFISDLTKRNYYFSSNLN